MAKIAGIDKMTYGELAELKDRVIEAMEARKVEDARAVKAKIEALVADYGFTMADVLGGAKRGRKAGNGTAVDVKFRNPKDPTQTWVGRGRKPLWLVEALDKGASIEKFAV